MVAVTLCVAAPLGCGGGDPTPSAPTPKPAAAEPDLAPAATERPDAGARAAAVAEGAPPKTPSSAAPLDPCVLLPSALAARVLAVPASELEVATSAGCRYTWTSTDEEAAAILSGLHEGASAADEQTRFEKLTRNPPSPPSPPSADGKAPTDPPRFSEVEGVGDEARLDHHTGKLFVRVGARMFAVSGYRSARQVTPTLAEDPTALAKQMKQAREAHVTQTLPMRRTMATALARGVIDALPR